MSKRTVLITGASKGIGEACALRMAKQGWRVLAGVREPADGDRLRAAAGTGLSPIRLDITDTHDIAEARAQVDALTGNAGLDALVNNAGIAVAGPLEYLPVDALRRQLEVNVTAQVAVTQALLPALRRARGRIVFMGSISGRSALPFVGAYAASKFALEAICDSLRAELRPFGLHVSIIEPGTIATPIWNTSIAAGERLLAAAPPELNTHYGKLLDGLRRHAARGIDGLPAERVADVVHHALTARSPRTRYLVGRDAKLRAMLQSLLPDRWRDALVLSRLRRL
jgi:NAD(P)-dependent dehydrogenase (short-subunit alcohol dehydrogenase family)